MPKKLRAFEGTNLSLSPEFPERARTADPNLRSASRFTVAQDSPVRRIRNCARAAQLAATVATIHGSAAGKLPASRGRGETPGSTANGRKSPSRDGVMTATPLRRRTLTEYLIRRESVRSRVEEPNPSDSNVENSSQPVATTLAPDDLTDPDLERQQHEQESTSVQPAHACNNLRNATDAPRGQSAAAAGSSLLRRLVAQREAVLQAFRDLVSRCERGEFPGSAGVLLPDEDISLAAEIDDSLRITLANMNDRRAKALQLDQTLLHRGNDAALSAGSSAKSLRSLRAPLSPAKASYHKIGQRLRPKHDRFWRETVKPNYELLGNDLKTDRRRMILDSSPYATFTGFISAQTTATSGYNTLPPTDKTGDRAYTISLAQQRHTGKKVIVIGDEFDADDELRRYATGAFDAKDATEETNNRLLRLRKSRGILSTLTEALVKQLRGVTVAAVELYVDTVPQNLRAAPQDVVGKQIVRSWPLDLHEIVARSPDVMAAIGFPVRENLFLHPRFGADYSAGLPPKPLERAGSSPSVSSLRPSNVRRRKKTLRTMRDIDAAFDSRIEPLLKTLNMKFDFLHALSEPSSRSATPQPTEISGYHDEGFKLDNSTTADVPDP